MKLGEIATRSGMIVPSSDLSNFFLSDKMFSIGQQVLNRPQVTIAFHDGLLPISFRVILAAHQ